MVQYAPNATEKSNNDTSESFHQELRKQLRLNEFQINGLVLCKLSICARKIALYTIANGLFLHANMYEIHLEKNEKKARSAHTISHIYHTIPGILSPHFIRSEFLHFVGRGRSTDRRFLALILPLIRYRVVVVAVSLTHARSLARRSFVLNFIFHLSFASN